MGWILVINCFFFITVKITFCIILLALFKMNNYLCNNIGQIFEKNEQPIHNNRKHTGEVFL